MFINLVREKEYARSDSSQEKKPQQPMVALSEAEAD